MCRLIYIISMLSCRAISGHILSFGHVYNEDRVQWIGYNEDRTMFNRVHFVDYARHGTLGGQGHKESGSGA